MNMQKHYILSNSRFIIKFRKTIVIGSHVFKQRITKRGGVEFSTPTLLETKLPYEPK